MMAPPSLTNYNKSGGHQEAAEPNCQQRITESRRAADSTLCYALLHVKTGSDGKTQQQQKRPAVKQVKIPNSGLVRKNKQDTKKRGSSEKIKQFSLMISNLLLQLSKMQK